MAELDDSVRCLRRQTFTQDWPLDEEIRVLASRLASHRSLANPSGQCAYIYLTRFVKALSEKHFGVPFAELKVLDWGCGKSHVSKMLRDLGPKHVESCDLLSEGEDSSFGQDVPIVRRFNINVKPLRHESVLPYDCDSFDVALSVGVLEHVSNEGGSLAEITRVLKSAGLFFCFVLPTRFSWTQQVSRWRGDNYHDRLYTKSRVRQILDTWGLNALDIWYRQLLPKNSVHYPGFRSFERVDLFATERTPLRYFATNVEFVSFKR